MNRIWLAASAIAVMGLAAPALAQPVAQPAAPRGDIRGFHGGPNALPRAIDRAQEATGGVVVEARFDRRGGKGGFDVLASRDGHLVSVRLERMDGRVETIRTNKRPDWMLKWNQRADIRIVRHAKVSLDQAVRTAEDTARGPAMAAGLARGDIGPQDQVKAYNVLIDLPGGHTRRIAIDANTGQVIDDPNALSDF